jgi:opacity protein-like surface antigen
MVQKIDITLVALFLLFFCGSAEAQNKRFKTYEVHLGIGAVNVMGDIGGGFSEFQISQTRPILYVGGRYDFNEYLSGKVNFFAGKAAGDDAVLSNAANNLHPLSFLSSVREVSAQVEWNFVHIHKAIGSIFAARHGVSGAELQTRPYIFAGMGFVYADADVENPSQVELPGETIAKHPYGGLALPIGIGIRTDLSFNWALGLELGGRFCTSDYIDGFHSSSSKHDDAYFFTTLHLAYKFQFAGGKLVKKNKKR